MVQHFWKDNFFVRYNCFVEVVPPLSSGRMLPCLASFYLRKYLLQSGMCTENLIKLRRPVDVLVKMEGKLNGCISFLPQYDNRE